MHKGTICTTGDNEVAHEHDMFQDELTVQPTRHVGGIRRGGCDEEEKDLFGVQNHDDDKDKAAATSMDNSSIERIMSISTAFFTCNATKICSSNVH